MEKRTEGLTEGLTEEPPLIYFEGQLTARERALLQPLLQRAEEVGGFAAGQKGRDVPPWIVVAGWGEGGPSYPVSVSRLGATLSFTARTASEVAERIDAWIQAHGRR